MEFEFFSLKCYVFTSPLICYVICCTYYIPTVSMSCPTLPILLVSSVFILVLFRSLVCLLLQSVMKYNNASVSQSVYLVSVSQSVPMFSSGGQGIQLLLLWTSLVSAVIITSVLATCVLLQLYSRACIILVVVTVIAHGSCWT